MPHIETVLGGEEEDALLLGLELEIIVEWPLLFELDD
jgi:hypothetical protein